ncbi:glycine-rich RNA-binding protein 10-like [Penaeus japonicus]|uniref:glycine-rich RNA-binding protein 10-like n=1 Tax=Penaeus japonicus TaxID=27405 RepID=UPI001C7149DA|nr:glycine-rich RNA-binding protein 10-like [Penaeus japonicus]
MSDCSGSGSGMSGHCCSGISGYGGSGWSGHGGCGSGKNDRRGRCSGISGRDGSGKCSGMSGHDGRGISGHSGSSSGMKVAAVAVAAGKRQTRNSQPLITIMARCAAAE